MLNNKIKNVPIHKIIGIVNKDVYVAENIMEYGDKKFLHCYIMQPLTIADVEKHLDRPDDEMRYYWKSAVNLDETEKGLLEWAHEVNEDARFNGLYYFGDNADCRIEFKILLKAMPEEQRYKIEHLTDMDWQKKSVINNLFLKDIKFDIVFDEALLNQIREIKIGNYIGIKEIEINHYFC